MSLTFSATSHVVNCGSGSAAMPQLDSGSFLAWIYPTAGNTTGRIISRGQGASGFKYLGTTSGTIAMEVSKNSDSANIFVVAKTWALPAFGLNKWVFVAGTYTTAGATTDQLLYAGDLTTPASPASTYSTQNNPAGTVDNEASSDQLLGRNGTTFYFRGRIGPCAIFNRPLTLGEIWDWQFRPSYSEGCVGMWMLGENGTGVQADRSGNFKNGTVSGTTLGSPVPLPSLYA